MKSSLIHIKSKCTAISINIIINEGLENGSTELNIGQYGHWYEPQTWQTLR